MARFPPPCHAVHRRLRLPHLRTRDDSPLRISSRRATRKGCNSRRLQAKRTCRSGRRGIYRTPSRHSNAGSPRPWPEPCHDVHAAAPRNKVQLIGQACDAVGLAPIKDMVAHAAQDRPVDWCVQSTASRKKRMLIADMDSTTIGQESIDEMAELKGIRPEIAAMRERSMRGELGFESGLRERMRLLGECWRPICSARWGVSRSIRARARWCKGAWRAYGAGFGRLHLFHKRRRRASRIRPRTGAMSSYGRPAALRALRSLFKGEKPSLPP